MKIKSLGIYLFAIMCLFITGCGEEKTKTASTTAQFDSVATSQGFTIYDNMELYTGVDYIVSSKVAAYDDMEIEMVEYIVSDYASRTQESHIESFSLLKSTGAHLEKEKGTNYYKYTLVSNNRYMVSTRIDNTLIFCKVMLTQKDKVTALLDELGY